MSTPPRNRIVIDLKQPLQARGASRTTRPRKHWPKVLGLLVLVVLAMLFAIGAGGYFWWLHYQTTPTYSLAVIIDAAQRNDMATFDRLVDSDKIIDSLASQITEKVAASPLGLVGGAAIRKQMDTLAPRLLPKLKQNFRQQLAGEIKDFSSQSGSRPFIVLALILPALVKTTMDNNTARIAATVRGQPVELTMQQVDKVWRIVSLKDDALIRRLADEVIQDLPVTGQTDSGEPRKRLRKRGR